MEEDKLTTCSSNFNQCYIAKNINPYFEFMHNDLRFYDTSKKRQVHDNKLQLTLYSNNKSTDGASTTY